MKEFTLAVIVIAFFGIASGQTRTEWQQKVAPSLLTKSSDGASFPFLIVLSSQANVKDASQLNTKEEKASYVFSQLKFKATQTQTGILSLLDDMNVPHQSLFIVNAIKATGNIDLIRTLASRPDVKKILDDADQKFAGPVEWSQENGSRQTIEWGIDMINADEVWALGYRGQGVVVGGEDTGYQWDHEAIKNQYRGYDADRDTVDHNYNWHDAIHEISVLSPDSLNSCGLNLKAPCDDFGHGSHTMGTMVGHDGDNEIGVAPDSKWCGCRNMERGNGSPFTYLECFQWFLAPTNLNDENPDPSKSPAVINNSWGCPESEGCDPSNWEILNQAVINLKLGGVVVVVSAGNDGSGCSSVTSPAAIYEASFSVGATAENDTIAGFSSRGPVAVDSSFRTKPNVSAPGVHVRSVKLGGGYVRSSGTSMAGPHVVGLVALMISANPSLAGKVDLIEDIIESTCVPKTTDQNCGNIPGSQVPNNTYGYGRVDALAAVQAALALIPTATSNPNPYADVSVYPNPVKDEFIIDAGISKGEMSFDLFDAQGRFVMHHQWNTSGRSIEKINLEANEPGMYFYRIMNAGVMKQGLVVKQ
ncbi:MAG: S8 family peptidase [Saprospiraceae bacterium]|uniref:S8 family peptidase n=1 Tax=Candidatus Opimibacter skivensis TaxID=2982028 RepID=A0A9D7SRF3_9BACT|nr:S8 family peptidase [Candidatus Opimibacter skivensis]